MHGLAHLVVTAETERQVADTATGLRLWQVLLNPAHGTNKVNAVCLMLFQTGSYGEDVHVEDNVLWWETNARQQLVGAFGDGYLAFVRCGLSLLVEGHHHDGGTQSEQLLGLTEEVCLAVLQTD